MGADARWVCHTCETVCPRGGRPIFQSPDTIKTRSGIQVLKEELSHITETLTIDDYDRKIGFLDDLSKWLGRHETHNIHIGSDYSTDMMDLDGYHDETVDGRIVSVTRHEARLAAVGAIEESCIKEIEGVITECMDMKKLPNTAARELYNRFSMRDL